jgi:invasion protein IalB
MQQTLSVQQGERSQRVLQAIVARQNQQRLLELSVPLGVDLRPGLLIQVDENPVGNLPYLTCNAAGCIALINLDDALWQQLRNGNKAKVAIRGVGQAENTVLELSLKGFTAASNALMAK